MNARKRKPPIQKWFEENPAALVVFAKVPNGHL
jgi:hypothetical protein